MPKLGSCSQFLSSASVGCWATCMGPCILAELGQSFIVKIDLRHVILSSRWARCEGRVSAWMLCVPRPQPTTPAGFGESCPHEIHETKDLGMPWDILRPSHWMPLELWQLWAAHVGQRGWLKSPTPAPQDLRIRATDDMCRHTTRAHHTTSRFFFGRPLEIPKDNDSMTMKGLYNVCCFQLCISTSSVLAKHSLIIWSTLPAF